MQAIFSDRLAKPIGPFSPAVRSNSKGYIYVSGQIGQSAETGKLVEGGIERQTEQAFANLDALLKASERSFAGRACHGVSDKHDRFRSHECGLCQALQGTLSGPDDDRRVSASARRECRDRCRRRDRREPLMSDTYERLIALLDAHKASYRLIDHAGGSDGQGQHAARPSRCRRGQMHRPHRQDREEDIALRAGGRSRRRARRLRENKVAVQRCHVCRFRGCGRGRAPGG